MLPWPVVQWSGYEISRKGNQREKEGISGCLVPESAEVVGRDRTGKEARAKHWGEQDHPFQGLSAICSAWSIIPHQSPCYHLQLTRYELNSILSFTITPFHQPHSAVEGQVCQKFLSCPSNEPPMFPHCQTGPVKSSGLSAQLLSETARKRCSTWKIQ